MEIDEERLEFYLDAKFDFSDGYLFSNCIRRPSLDYLHTLEKEKKLSKYDIETFYNRFHLWFICESPEIQRKMAVQLWKRWRFVLNRDFPDKHIAIEIKDYGYRNNVDVILYLYELPGQIFKKDYLFSSR